MVPPRRMSPPATAGSRSSRSWSTLRSSASASRVAVGAAHSAAASSAVRVGRGSASSRSQSRPSKLAPGPSARCRANSRACSGLPPDASATARSSLRVSVTSRCSRITWKSAESGSGSRPTSVRCQSGSHSFSGRPLGPRPGDHQHRQVAEPGQGLAERGGRSVVEPLGVVDQDDQRPRGGAGAEHAAKGERDRAGFGAVAVVEEQRGADRRALRGRERVVLLRGKRRQQLAQRREREPALGLERPRGQDSGVAGQDASRNATASALLPMPAAARRRSQSPGRSPRPDRRTRAARRARCPDR